ncbi:uncharacterized protein V6R79_009549 [Siganus canaliculatus]
MAEVRKLFHHFVFCSFPAHIPTSLLLYNISRFLCLFWQLPRTHPVKHQLVSSPLYPQPYPPNLQKQWNLWVAEGYQIQLSITHLDIKASPDCSEDSLTVLYDNEVIGKFCGQENSTDRPKESDLSILSPSNRLTLVFRTSDFPPELQLHSGFSAVTNAIDVDECLNQDPGDESLCSQICVNSPGSYYCSCYAGYRLDFDYRTCLISCDSHVFNKQEGHMSSPGYPGPSPPYLSCKYVISLESRFFISLHFADNFHIESVDTEDGPMCQQHWLQVTIPHKEPLKLCGGESPGVITTNSSTVILDYQTDEEGLSRGWSLNYTSYAIDCGEPEPLLNGGFSLLSGFQYNYGSVVQYHCDEPFYSFPGGTNITFTCEADRKWRLNQSNVTLTCLPVCGRPTRHISVYQRIMGGSEAPDYTLPWQVLVNIKGIRVGGMVIADRWILTAAHDLVRNERPVPAETVRIYMGHTDVETLLNFPVPAASIHIHPKYKNLNGSNFNNDIALIKLQDQITFNASVMPLCLPAEGAAYITGMMGMLSGFGIMAFYPPRIPKQLQYVQLPVVEQEVCHSSVEKLMKTRNNIPRLTGNMFCAGLPEGGRDSCLGDKGGPFALEDDGRFWAAGIVSWGVDCGQQGTFGVYTRVSNYLDWIRQTVEEHGNGLELTVM